MKYMIHGFEQHGPEDVSNNASTKRQITGDFKESGYNIKTYTKGSQTNS